MESTKKMLNADWGEEMGDDVVLVREEDLDIDYDSDAVSEPTMQEFAGDNEKPVKREGFDTCVICDGTPVVDEAKMPKLHKVLLSLFAQVGTVVNLYIPISDGQSPGLAFVEYETVEQAKEAVERINNYKLDKKHTLLVNHFSDIETYSQVPEEHNPPEIPAYKDQENFNGWLLDPMARMQYVCRHSDQVDVYWNDIYSQTPVLDVSRPKWSQSFSQWSNTGGVLATFHERGIRLWAGNTWTEVMRFEHRGVQLIDFSPCDRYLVTYSAQAPQQLIVWEVRTGKPLRMFDQLESDGQPPWPYFKWSHDGKFFARVAENLLYVFEAETCKLIANQQGKHKPVEIPAIKACEWSPSQHIISYWQPEVNNRAACITLLEIPTLKEIRQKNIFSVGDCQFFWHPDGDFLATRVDRMSKGGKAKTHTDFELFCCKWKNVPVEVIEFKDPVTAFGWEPKGCRFAVSYGKVAASQTLAIHELKPKGNIPPKVELTIKKEKLNITNLYWSPKGRLLLTAALNKQQDGGALMFWDSEKGDLLGEGEHYMANGVAWDPTGQFVATSVSYWFSKHENGYKIWNFHGKLLHRVPKERFFQFQWRPLPRSLLTEEDLKLAAQHVAGDWGKEFDADDRKRRDADSADIAADRAEAARKFQEIMAKKQERHRAQAAQRRQLRGGYLSDDPDDWEEREVVTTVVLEETVEIV